MTQEIEETPTPRTRSNEAGPSSSRRKRKSNPLVAFVRENKAWVLVPSITVVLLLVALAIGSASSVAPFFYTLF